MYDNSTLSGVIRYGTLALFFLVPNVTYAYTLLAPIFNTTSVSDLSDYLGIVFSLVLGIGSILAVVMLVVAGLQYIASGANESLRGAAKERIRNALFGLIIALGAWVVLNAINPGLVDFDSPNNSAGGGLGSGAMGVTLPGGLNTGGGGERYCYQVSSATPVTCFPTQAQCSNNQPTGSLSSGCRAESNFTTNTPYSVYCFNYSYKTATHDIHPMCRTAASDCNQARTLFGNDPSINVLSGCALRTNP